MRSSRYHEFSSVVSIRGEKTGQGNAAEFIQRGGHGDGTEARGKKTVGSEYNRETLRSGRVQHPRASRSVGVRRGIAIQIARGETI